MYDLRKPALLDKRFSSDCFILLLSLWCHSHSIKSMFADLLVSVEFDGVEPKTRQFWNNIKLLHTRVTYDYIHNDTYCTQWLQSIHLTNGKLHIIIFPHILILSICSSTSKTQITKLYINTVEWSRVIRVCKKYIFSLSVLLTNWKRTIGVLFLYLTLVSFPFLFQSTQNYFSFSYCSQIPRVQKIAEKRFAPQKIFNDIFSYIMFKGLYCTTVL